MTRARLLLVVVCLGALLLRSIGLQFGLPAVYNPDEVAIMARALSFAKGTLNPHNFLYPTLYFYVLFAWVGAYLALLFGTGRVASVAALQQMYFTHPTTIYSVGRSLGVAAGTATVWLVHRLGNRVGGPRTAIAAAVFLAVAPLHVRDSHYVKHDVPATLAIVFAYLAMSRLWPASAQAAAGRPAGLEIVAGAGGRQASVLNRLFSNELRDPLLAGAACGVAFSTHYYAIFLALPLAWVIVRRFGGLGRGPLLRALGAAAMASTVTFFILSPFLLLEPLTAWRDIVANRAIVVDRAVADGAFGPALRYAQMLGRDSMGLPVVALAALGAAWMLVVDRARAIWLLAFPAPFLLFIANTAPASRYLNPVLPFMALFAGWALATAAARFELRAATFWVALAAAALPGVATSVKTDRFFRQPDTRTLAQAYIESQVPAGAGILIQPYSVSLTMARDALAEALTEHLGSTAAATTKFQLQLELDPYPSPAYRLLYLGSGGLDVDKQYVSVEEVAAPGGLALLRRLGVAFVVFKRYNDPDRATAAFLGALEREARLIATFSPFKPGFSAAEQGRVEPFLHNTDTRLDDALERPGPPLEIWQLDHAGR